MRKLITKRVADSAKPKDKAYQIADTAISGFVLRVQPSGAKVWKLRYTKPDGTRTVRTLGRMPVMTCDMARQKVTDILQGNDPDEVKAPEPVPEVLTFQKYLDDYYAKYLRQHHSRPEETLGYLSTFNLGDKPLADITLADAEAYRIDRKAAGKAATTINRETATFKAALERAVDWDLLPVNPWAKLKPLKTDKRRVVRYLSDDEENRLREALSARDDTKRAERVSANEWRKERGHDPLPALGSYADNLTPMVLLALNTGLRRGELWNLLWGDIDMKARMLTVHGKGAKSKQTRHIPLNDEAVAVLKAHKGKVSPMPSKPVFGRAEFKTAYTGVLKVAEVEHFRFHDLRHTFASRLVAAGVPLNTVRELMGHASLDMTLVYAHLAPDTLRAAVDLIGGKA